MHRLIQRGVRAMASHVWYVLIVPFLPKQSASPPPLSMHTSDILPDNRGGQLIWNHKMRGRITGIRPSRRHLCARFLVLSRESDSQLSLHHNCGSRSP